MSGVYWGIVAGLVALVAVFFVCMESDVFRHEGIAPSVRSQRERTE